MPSVTLPPPGLPRDAPCLSFWHQTTRSFEYLNERTTAVLPTEADIVVIGAGLSGSLIAYELLKGDLEAGGEKRKVVLLEAREAASGASGRNAGHTRPDAYRGYAGYKAIHGKEQALKIIANEKQTLENLQAWLAAEKIPGDCDVEISKTFDVCMTDEFLEYAHTSYEVYKADGGDVAGIRILNKEQARKECRIPDALGAFEWKAGSTHPAKITHNLLRRCIQMGLNLQMHTPVTAVTGSQHQWTIHTPRGDVTTPVVIHATNAYASTLLPFMASQITPTKAQAHAVVPTTAYTGKNILDHTYSIRWAIKNFYSVIQRKTDGIIVLGVSRSVPEVPEDIVKTFNGTTDDQTITEPLLEAARRKMGEVFEDWGEERPGEGLQYAWSGIIAMTKDLLPFVGETPLKGQWICAGHGGHGMARIFCCAPGLVKLINGGKWEDTGLPEVYQITERRLRGHSKDLGENAPW